MLPRATPANNSPMQQISTTISPSPNAESPAQTAMPVAWPKLLLLFTNYSLSWPQNHVDGGHFGALLVRFERTDAVGDGRVPSVGVSRPV
jgi:hypothetical protein